MNPRLAFLALCLLTIVPAYGQAVSMNQISISPTNADNGAVWGSNIRLTVSMPVAQPVVAFDGKKSTIIEATDSHTGQPVKVDVEFHDNKFSGDRGEEADYGVTLTVTAPPQVPHSWVSLKGTLVFRTLAATKNQKTSIRLVEGTVFKIGETELTVKNVRRGEDFGSFTISRDDGSLGAIHQIRFSDAAGNPVEVQARGSGSSSSNGKITSESRSFSCPGDLEVLHAEFEMIEKEETQEIPLDITVPVNP